MIDAQLAWLASDQAQRLAHRSRNSIGTGTVKLVDDTQPAQVHQAEFYPTELRDNLVRAQAPGISSVPVSGAKVVTLHHGGDRANAVIVATEDVRYRPTGLKPGELQLYLIDGANALTGLGGTTRSVLRAALGWITSLFGQTLNIGDSNTVNITITGSGLIKLAGNVEITGTLKVDGATTVQDINIQGTETGGGSA